MTGGGVFSNADYLWTLGEERRDRKKDREAANKTKLKGLVRDLKGTGNHLILRDRITGAWLSVCGNTVPGTVFSATEFRYFLCARYNVFPLNPQSRCDGCDNTFGAMHAISCRTGSLFIAHQNGIHDKLIYLSRNAFTSAYVSAKPLIHHGRSRYKQGIHQDSEKYKKTWGDMMI